MNRIGYLLLLTMAAGCEYETRQRLSIGSDDAKVGSIWYDEDKTPFSTNVTRIEILAVKDGYAQYKILGRYSSPIYDNKIGPLRRCYPYTE